MHSTQEAILKIYIENMVIFQTSIYVSQELEKYTKVKPESK